MTDPTTDRDERPADFIRDIVAEDVRQGTHGGRVQTRFPPEPNGYLHIGHAKAICIDFGLAEEFGGVCNLRFDDTNPTREEVEYVESMKEDLRWLGFAWPEPARYASDYFEQLYGFAVELVEAGLAYVDEQDEDTIREQKGDFHSPGRSSPHRDRPPQESLELLRRMRDGELPDGAMVLRARIDMAHANMNMRDPVMYRIRHARHHRTGDAWCIYPMYDWAHGQSDAIEGVTHSICTLEFEDHRPLYDWYVEHISAPCRPRQFEFSRLNVSHTVVSKRRLLRLVQEGRVSGWDDPRMPTLSGMRRRGYTPAALRAFIGRTGVTKRDSVVDVSLLEHALREDLNRTADRAMAVLRPLKLVITNFPEGHVEWLEATNHPEYPERGTRRVPLTRELWVERDDFKEDAPRKWHRLAPGKEVRLRYACLVTCDDVVKDPATGEVTELRCRWDPDSRGGSAPDGRKVRGTLHWVSAEHAVEAEVRLYERLFTVENPLDVPEGGSFHDHLNPASLEVLTGCRVEPALAEAEPGVPWQFERLGYFCADGKDSAPGRPVFNRTITLRDSWARIERAQSGGEK